MANTYTQCYVHLVFAPKNREALIKRQWHNELEKYITGIIQNHKHKLLAIGSMPDHIHIFIGYHLNQLIPDLVETIKTSTTAWIKYNGLLHSKFEWQRGYGAFTHSHSQVKTVINYVLNQETHHKKKTFKDEYYELLKEFEITFREEYLFDFFD
ncbi:IS200/IS605 family transposase [Niabella drilacis]|uniref:REP element-mobilizing transposase RayT n=1 Tax=Niabella drilacis (strain DSM 25811 / CCM 8410 / CCUG 62505 / LMG 26954 / E90) TaxID=1285928 RepID=A0A1G6JE31_NIADE|nr:IS200/IS605 family transposase [Niabella drilacis]SDC16913.1 REP element-mobilizing transposase RayT [Niabella drilacis]